MRKLTAILLTVFCLLSLVSVSVIAADNSEPNSCTDHDFTGGVCTICGYSVLGSDWLAPDFAEGDYTMVALPDTQMMVKYWPQDYYEQMQWIVDNKEELNIQAVLHMGDMVQDNTAKQWTVSKTGTDILDAAGITWMPMRGNHDASDSFNSYYDYATYGSRSWFGGSYVEGKLDHYYWFVNAGGREYLMLSLGWAPHFLVLNWAQGVVEANPDKNVIIICHAYMNSDGTPLSWDTDLSPEMRNELLANLPQGITPELAISLIPDGDDIWAAFKDYKNVVLGLSGHVHSPDIARYTAANGAGKNVSSLLIDRQDDDIKNRLGMVALLSFHESSDTVEVNWYSTRYDALYKANNQFTINVPHTVAEESHTHSYTAAVTAPTCTEGGYTTHSCACGDSYVDSDVPAAGHKFSQWTQTVAPTEETEGEEVRVCPDCGEIETNKLPVIVHSHSYTAAVTEPTCTDKGYTTYTCACGDSYVEKGKAALGHDYEGKITIPSCTEGGYSVYTCTRCSKEFRVTDQGPKGHDWIDWLSDAYEHWRVCEECELVGERGEHNFGEWRRDGLGMEFRRCLTCRYKETRKVAGETIENPFTDVSEKDYFYEPVLWAVGLGVTKGVSDDRFAPADPCTRAQVVTFLWRAMGSPAPKTEDNPFSDVSKDSYYYDAVLWAVENGITNGLSADKFGPGQTCTRGQVVTFLYRTAENQELSSSKNPFKDVSAKDYFYTPVLWAVENGITNGLSADSFGPGQTCTRGQIVTFLYRAIGK